MTRKRSFNQARDGSVYLPLSRPAAPVPERADQLSDDRVKLLALAAAYQHRAGLTAADYCESLMLFVPTPEDRAGVAARIEAHPEWADELFIAEHGFDAYFLRRYGNAPWRYTPRARDADGLGVVVGV